MRRRDACRTIVDALATQALIEHSAVRLATLGPCPAGERDSSGGRHWRFPKHLVTFGPGSVVDYASC